MVRLDALRQQVLELRRQIVACRDCVTLAPWRKFPAEYIGALETGYMLVGEAPGYVSWRNQRAFSNPRNYVLREALEGLADPRYRNLEDLFYCSDVVRCQPAVDATHANRAPTATEIRLCSRHLRDEIELLRPGVYLAIGKLAAEFLTGRAIKITQEHMKRYTGPHESEVIVLMHPSPRAKSHLERMGLSLALYREQVRGIFVELIRRLDSRRRERRLSGPAGPTKI